jgi:hypothetical protein
VGDVDLFDGVDARQLLSGRAQVDAVLANAETTDAAEDEAFGADRRGDELPDELRRRETRLAAIREAKRSSMPSRR